MLWRTTGKSARLTDVAVTTIGAGASLLRRLSLSLRRRRGVLTWRRPDPIVQLMGEAARGGNPAVRSLRRINPVGGRRAARQYGQPREPSERHRRKSFFNATQARSETVALRTFEPGQARRAPVCRRFKGAGSCGEPFVNTIILAGAGRHQPNLTDSRTVWPPPVATPGFPLEPWRPAPQSARDVLE